MSQLEYVTCLRYSPDTVIVEKKWITFLIRQLSFYQVLLAPMDQTQLWPIFCMACEAFTLSEVEKKEEKVELKKEEEDTGENQEGYEVCKAWFLKKKKKRCLLTTVVEDT